MSFPWLFCAFDSWEDFSSFGELKGGLVNGFFPGPGMILVLGNSANSYEPFVVISLAKSTEGLKPLFLVDETTFALPSKTRSRLSESRLTSALPFSTILMLGIAVTSILCTPSPEKGLM